MLKIAPRFFLLFFALNALTACLTLQKFSPEQAPHIRTIGVASGIGETFSFDSFGMFTNRSNVGSIANWRLDDQIFTAASQQLSTQYNVKRITVDQSKLKLPDPALFDSAQAVSDRFFSAINPDPDVDAYLAIVPHEYNGDLEGLKKNVRGLGLLQRFSAENVIAFGAYQIFLFDARSRKSLAWWYGYLPDGKNEPMRILMGVPPQLWANSVAEASPEQLETLRRLYTGILNTSVPYTLQRANLAR